jgi:hypothetical protein
MRSTVEKLFEAKHPYLSSVLWLNFRQKPEQYSRWGNIMDSDQMKEVEFMVAELGQFSPKNENDPIPLDSIMPSHQKEFLFVTWAKGTEVSMEALQDDKFRVMSDMAAALGYSARVTIEQIAADEWFNKGFTTGLAADNVSIYGTHGTAGGFTIQNALNVDPDTAGVEAFLNYYADLRSERGHKIQAELETIVCPSQLSFGLWEVVESVQRAGTNNNNINSLRRFNLRVEVCNFLDSPSAWFGMGDKSQHKAKGYFRMRPTIVKDTRYTTQSGLTGLLWRSSFGVSDYRLLVASMPS